MSEPRTPQEIEELKANWLNDPCWDIEYTEGFEAHQGELEAWRDELTRKQRQAEDERLQKRAAELGCTVALVRYIEELESRIKWLQLRMDELI